MLHAMRPTSSRGSIPRSAGASSGLSFASDGSSSGRSSCRGTGRRSIATAAGSTMRSSIISGVDISKRPVTGAGGGLARQRASTANESKAVESAAYYSKLLHQKIEEILNEIRKLELETEMADGTSEIRRKLEHNHKIAVEDVQQLEAALADLNLAKDKARSGANHEDVRDETIGILNRNKTLEHEVDEIFVTRKRTESRILKLENELKKMRHDMEQRFLDSPDKLYKCEMYLDLIDDMHSEESEQEGKMQQLKNQIRSMESDGSQSRYMQAKERVDDLECEIGKVEADIHLAAMDESEARGHLLSMVKQIDKEQKQLDRQAAATQLEIDSLLEEQSELYSQLRFKSYVPKEDSVAVKLLHKKDEEQKQFLADMPEIKAQLEEEQQRMTAAISALEEDLENKKAAKSLELPSREELELMQDEVEFTEKHLENNKHTINRLHEQQKTRERELEKIITLEDKIDAELFSIAIQTDAMKAEMAEYKSPEELQASADTRRDNLIEMTENCNVKIGEMNGLLKEASAKHEEMKNALESDPNYEAAKSLKSKLLDQGEEIINLEKQVDGLKAKDDYASIKAECLHLVNRINDAIIEKQ